MFGPLGAMSGGSNSNASSLRASTTTSISQGNISFGGKSRIDDRLILLGVAGVGVLLLAVVMGNRPRRNRK